MSSAPSFQQQKIPFHCPHCGHFTEVEQKFAGRSGPCVGCSNIVTVPTLESLMAPPPSANTPTVRSRAHSAEKPMWIKVGMGLGAVLSLCVIGTVIWMFLQPAFAAARSAAKCTECEENLRLIGAAIENYYEEKGHYPPAMTFDGNGKPLHSWRVLILPYLGHLDLYEDIKLNEPFNSKHNQQFIDRMPVVFRCPEDETALAGETSYLAIVGDNTLINSETPASLKAGYDGPVLRDHRSETMVVLEACECSVNWMRPKDITLPNLANGFNVKGNANSKHVDGVNILMADQSIIRLEYAETEDLRGMATIDGGNEYIEVLQEMDY